MTGIYCGVTALALRYYWARCRCFCCGRNCSCRTHCHYGYWGGCRRFCFGLVWICWSSYSIENDITIREVEGSKWSFGWCKASLGRSIKDTAAERFLRRPNKSRSKKRRRTVNTNYQDRSIHSSVFRTWMKSYLVLPSICPTGFCYFCKDMLVSAYHLSSIWGMPGLPNFGQCSSHGQYSKRSLFGNKGHWSDKQSWGHNSDCPVRHYYMVCHWSADFPLDNSMLCRQWRSVVIAAMQRKRQIRNSALHWLLLSEGEDIKVNQVIAAWRK